MKYSVKLIQTATYQIEVKAKDEEEAEEMALELFEKARNSNNTIDYFVDDDVEVDEIESWFPYSTKE